MRMLAMGLQSQYRHSCTCAVGELRMSLVSKIQPLEAGLCATVIRVPGAEIELKSMITENGAVDHIRETQARKCPSGWWDKHLAACGGATVRDGTEGLMELASSPSLPRINWKL